MKINTVNAHCVKVFNFDTNTISFGACLAKLEKTKIKKAGKIMKLTNVCTNCQTVENEGVVTVFSYGTPVLCIAPNMFDQKLSSLTRLWGGYSATTMRHINKALTTINGGYYINRTLALMGGYISFTKKLWDSMPVMEA